jgi:hypothetical protein
MAVSVSGGTEWQSQLAIRSAAAVILRAAKDLHLFVIKGVLQILRFAQDDRKRFAQDDSARTTDGNKEGANLWRVSNNFTIPNFRFGSPQSERLQRKLLREGESRT